MRKVSLCFAFLLLAILSTLPAVATTVKNLEAESNWLTCTTCGNKDSGGYAAPHSMTQKVKSPSLNGSASQFWLGGGVPYSDVIWWKRLGGSQSSNFIYDLWFYVKDPTAAQALEFDVNDSINNQWYVFGTECNYRQTRTWRVWDTKNAKWISTGIACAPPKAYSWNHVTLEFKRANGKANFVAVTLNRSKHYINQSYYPKSSPGGYQTSVAFQMDGNYQQKDFSVWINQMLLTHW
ncbi:hypothetical protein Acid345_1817 [Candidatus Koribacter versatilis Ellin345]|uniref:Uncharacterized protein n=1 Tax=Koribacter versatilis (strain Ellin345) TaxID=204669 RepID=Q1IQN2_KORVE|nr:hypothetical protein [Candidatus Koribacter versatilis]ABF40818.1 hypothetical protein Acid345_1817 [Candidatus Koribacter versatilis Ellin345]